jgi:RHS repeat-associated protein
LIDDSNGEVVHVFETDEFGRVSRDTNPGLFPFGFAGCLYDRVTRLCHFGSRDYDPEVGRWLQRDPIGFAGGDSNLYGYVINDPINYVDPTGLMKLPETPAGLPEGWERDYSHKDPNGERWRYKDTDRYMDFHKGRPGADGWKGKDHWHDSGSKEHKKPGDEVPCPEPKSGSATFSVPDIPFVPFVPFNPFGGGSMGPSNVYELDK